MHYVNLPVFCYQLDQASQNAPKWPLIQACILVTRNTTLISESNFKYRTIQRSKLRLIINYLNLGQNILKISKIII